MHFINLPQEKGVYWRQMQFLQGRKILESGESKKRRLKANLVYGHVDFQKLALKWVLMLVVNDI